MDYISPERSPDGTGDPGPLFGDQDGNLLEHMDYHGEGITQHESPLNGELLSDPGNQISYLTEDSLPFLNDQVPCSTIKSASTSPASPLNKGQGHLMHMGSDVQNDVAEQNLYHKDSEALPISAGYAIHQKSEVVNDVLPPELHESIGNDTSTFQQETAHSDAYLGNSLLVENSSNDYQPHNSGADDEKIPNSCALQMENDTKLHETFHKEENGTEDKQMNSGNYDNNDDQDNGNFNPTMESSSYLDEMDHEYPGTKNGISTPGNQWDSPPEQPSGLNKSTPSPGIRVSLSPHAHSSGKLESQHTAKEVGKLSHSQSTPPRCHSRSPERHDTNNIRASSRELSPHARQNSPRERKARRESRHGDESPRRRSPSPRRKEGSPRRRSPSPRRKEGSPRRRSPSPRRKEGSTRRRSPSPRRKEGSPRRMSPSPRRKECSPRRRSPSPRRKVGSPRRRFASPRRKEGSPRRRSASPRRKERSPRRRSASPRRRASPKRRGSPRRKDSPPRRRDSPARKRNSPTRKRDRSKSRSPSRKNDTSRHRREHGKSRSRSPHTRDHHKRSPRRRHSPRCRSPPSNSRHHSPRRPWSPPANRKTGLGKPGRNLFVAGFSYATTERELEKKFAKFGRVTSARVVRDKRSGDSRGFGFLSLERDEDADAAIRACDETEWNGRIILVEKSKAPAW